VKALKALPMILRDWLSKQRYERADEWFMIALIASWTLLGGWALAALMWLVAGRERVQVEQGTLTLERGVGIVRRRRRYDLRQVTRLRVLSEKEARMGLLLMLTPGLAFDYGGRTVQWGLSIDEIEARVIVERLGELGVSRSEE
jgi:hypothetical protein